MLARMDGEDYFLDYREKAPLTASRDMYLDSAGEVIPKSSLVGIRAAGVPGTVDGLWKAHKKFGTIPWAKLLAPAIGFAERGFEVHPKKAEAIPDIMIGLTVRLILPSILVLWRAKKYLRNLT